MDLKKLAENNSYLAKGHRTCQGCAIPIIVRTALRALDSPTVVVCATGCLQVTTTPYPQTSWELPYMHSALENVGATVAGIESAYIFQQNKSGNIALKKSQKEIKIIAFGGDGATYDIGLQSLSAAFERGHNFLYLCYDNQAYMNTGVQRSSATPLGAWTTTSERGVNGKGKKEIRKSMTEIALAHKLPYIAQASPSHILDLYEKVKKALEIKGPKFINVLSPCPLGWKYSPELTVKLANLAVNTRFWPLFEAENGRVKITVPVENPLPLIEFLKPQGRFAHLFKDKNSEIIKSLEIGIEQDWQRLLAVKNKTAAAEC